VAVVELPGNPFQAIPTADGCFVFVSLVGPVEPGDPRRPPKPGAPMGGVAVVGRADGEPSLIRVVKLEGSPYGMVLTHDGQLLIVTSDDRVAFIDPTRLIAGSADAVLGYLRDAPTAGRVYANVTPDDRWLFLSDESAQTISVVNLAKARASGFDESAVVGQIPVGRAPIALTFSPDHRLLYTTSQVAPAAYGWPAVCRAPGSDTTRQRTNYAKGAVLVVDVARATRDPANAVVAAVAAGCNPVRLVTSPHGDIAYVSARTDNALLAFDTGKLLTDSAHALIARIPVGDAPVGIAVLKDGAWLAVTNSNRFGDSTATQSLMVIDARTTGSGKDAVLGRVPAGIFPRELRVTEDQRTLLLTNFGSRTLAVIDVARLPVVKP
jgi:DNA-binding beta-propeller fold protein YncE